jgi:hypothetical protein
MSTLDTTSPELGVYTLREFAELFRMSRGAVYKAHREGRLVISKNGASSLITRAEAKRFQDSFSTELRAPSEAAIEASLKARTKPKPKTKAKAKRKAA